LRASGVASDPAASTAREVERRVIALGVECVSPALIHALTSLALPKEIFGGRSYAARRVAFSAVQHHPHPNAALAIENPLPSCGSALEQFWIQAVHSPEVAEAVRNNLLSIDPCPSAADTLYSNASDKSIDPLTTEFQTFIEHFSAGPKTELNVRADSPERVDALATALAQLSSTSIPANSAGSELSVHFKTVSEKRAGCAPRSMPVTINAGGLMAREALRDPERAAIRLSELAGVAARVHREREDYFERSAVRGLTLPIAVAGLWNATAWLQGSGFDTTHAPIGAHAAIAPLCQALRIAIEKLRAESGMELVLTASAPLIAERRLWRNDRGFFLDDGQKLNAASAYETDLKLSTSMDDFVNRLDFAKAVGDAFDEPPALSIEASLSPEIDVAQWKELFESFTNAGLACLRITFGGSARAIPNLTRAIRSYRIGFPLLDGLK
jgi:hypothetical protein